MVSHVSACVYMEPMRPGGQTKHLHHDADAEDDDYGGGDAAKDDNDATVANVDDVGDGDDDDKISCSCTRACGDNHPMIMISYNHDGHNDDYDDHSPLSPMIFGCENDDQDGHDEDDDDYDNHNSSLPPIILIMK